MARVINIIKSFLTGFSGLDKPQFFGEYLTCSLPLSLPLEAHHQPPPNTGGIRPSVTVASVHEGGDREKKSLIKIDLPDKDSLYLINSIFLPLGTFVVAIDIQG